MTTNDPFYEIIFDNAGGATLQTDSYVHYYLDMNQLAIDVQTLVKTNGDTSDWYGNEPENRIDDEHYCQNVENGGYKRITNDDEMSEFDNCSWNNVRDYINAFLANQTHCD